VSSFVPRELEVRGWDGRIVKLALAEERGEKRYYSDEQGRKWLEDGNDNPKVEEEHNQPELVDGLELRVYDVDFYLLDEAGETTGDGGSIYEGSVRGNLIAEALSPEQAMDAALTRAIPPGSRIYLTPQAAQRHLRDPWNLPPEGGDHGEGKEDWFHVARWKSTSIEYFGPCAWGEDQWVSANAMEIDWEKTVEALSGAAG
jgi:hypothetical protein